MDSHFLRIRESFLLFLSYYNTHNYSTILRIFFYSNCLFWEIGFEFNDFLYYFEKSKSIRFFYRNVCF